MTSLALKAAAKARFFDACPVCAARETSPVVDFAELSFVRCGGCGLLYKSEQVPGLGVGYEDEYFRFNRAGYLRRWNHRVRKCRRQVLACLEYAPRAHAARYRLLRRLRAGGGEARRPHADGPRPVELRGRAVPRARLRGGAGLAVGHAAARRRLRRGDVQAHARARGGPARRAARHRPRAVARRRGLPRGAGDAAYWKLALMPRTGRSFRPDRRGWQHHVYFFEANLEDACRRAGLEPVKRGKAIFRRRLARGVRWPWEALRFAWLAAWNGTARTTRFAREMQLIVRKPVV